MWIGFCSLMESPCHAPCRQVVESHYPDAFRPFYGDFSRVIAFSYLWHTAEHPDPDGLTLRLVKKALRLFKSLRQLEHSFSFFWDFASLYQKPRTPAQNNTFKMALDSMAYLYIHPYIQAFQCTGLPQDACSTRTYNLTPYTQRGWPFAEASWIFMVNDVPVFDVSLLKKDDLDLEGCIKRSDSVPLTPCAFDLALDTRCFTNENVDRPRLKRMYRESMQYILQLCTHLNYIDRGWSDDSGKLFVDVLNLGYTSKSLQALNLENNNLGLPFCVEFTHTLESHCHLCDLNLSQNPIGDDGVLVLAPALIRVERVQLDAGGLTSTGCASLAKVARVAREESCLEILHLARNKIMSSGAVQAFLEATTSLNWLSVVDNPFLCEDEASRETLQNTCRQRSIELKCYVSNSEEQLTVATTYL